MLSRERPLAPSGLLQAPAPLPSLRDALQRRAAIFGPVDLDEVSAAPRGPLVRLAGLLRTAADLLDAAS